MYNMSKYLLKSVKAIEFYNKNPSLDFDTVNELFIDLIQNITNTIQDSISVNEVKALLHTINKKVDGQQNYMQMTYDRLHEQRDQYVKEVKDLMENRDKGSDLLALIRDMNNTLIDKTTCSIVQQFPKMSEDIKAIQRDMVEHSQLQFQRVVEQERAKGGYDPEALEKTIQGQYQSMSDRMMQTLHNVFSQESMFYQNNMELRHFLERQKNSTKKGKESEHQLEASLTRAYPHGVVVRNGGESNG